MRPLLRGSVSHENSVELLAERLEDFLQALPREGPFAALEIGCGDGRGTEVLYQSLCRWHGPGVLLYALDLDVHKLLRARDRLGADVRFLSGDLYGLPLPQGCVDYLFALNTFYWADRPKLLAEASRVLREDGKVFAYDVLPVGTAELRPLVTFTLSREQILQ